MLKGAAHYRSPDFFIIFFLEIACLDDEFNWIFIADFNKASRPSKVILLITACHVTTYHHNTVTKCQRWRNFKNSFFYGWSGFFPWNWNVATKKSGDSSSFCSARSKVSTVASTEPTSLLIPNYISLQKRQRGRVSLRWIYPVGTCVLENSVQTERAAGQHTCCAQLNFCLIWGLKSFGTKSSVQTNRRRLPLCCKHNDTSGTGLWKT